MVYQISLRNQPSSQLVNFGINTEAGASLWFNIYFEPLPGFLPCKINLNLHSFHFFVTASRLHSRMAALVPKASYIPRLYGGVRLSSTAADTSSPPTFINKNPRNLERMRLARKQEGWKLEPESRAYWHRWEIAADISDTGSNHHVTICIGSCLQYLSKDVLHLHSRGSDLKLI